MTKGAKGAKEAKGVQGVQAASPSPSPSRVTGVRVCVVMGRAPHTTVGSAGRVGNTFAQNATRNIRVPGRREHTRPLYHCVATVITTVAMAEAAEAVGVVDEAWGPWGLCPPC